MLSAESLRLLSRLGMVYGGARRDDVPYGPLEFRALFRVLEEEGITTVVDYKNLPTTSRQFIDELLVVFYRHFLLELRNQSSGTDFCLRFALSQLNSSALLERVANVSVFYSSRSLFTSERRLSFRGVDDEHGHTPTFRYYSDNTNLVSKLLQLKPLLTSPFGFLIPESVEDVFEREDAPTQGGMSLLNDFIAAESGDSACAIEVPGTVIPSICVPEISLPLSDLVSVRQDHADVFGRFHNELVSFYTHLSTAENEASIRLCFEKIADEVRSLDRVIKRLRKQMCWEIGCLATTTLTTVLAMALGKDQIATVAALVLPGSIKDIVHCHFSIRRAMRSNPYWVALLLEKKLKRLARAASLHQPE